MFKNRLFWVFDIFAVSSSKSKEHSGMIYKRQKKSQFLKNFERVLFDVFDLVNNSRLCGR